MAAQDYLASLQYGAPGGGVGVNADKMDPEFANRLAALIQAAEKATGDKVSVFEGYRDPARSAQLRADYKGVPINYGGKTYQPTPGMKGKYQAAAPMVSEHNKGMAADIRAGKEPDKYPSGAAYDYMVKHAKEFGLENLGASDPAHFQIPPSEYKQALAGKPLQPFKNYNPDGLTPPMNIPQVGTALDVIDHAVPRPLPSQVATAYAVAPIPRNRPLAPSAVVPPVPQPRPREIEMLQRLTNPTGRLPDGFDPMSLDNPGPPPMFGTPPALPPTQAQMQAIRAVPAAAPVPMPGPPVALNAMPPVPMPGRPAALSAAQPALIQAQPPQLPTQRPSAPVALPSVQLRLASGKTIAPGVYTQPDGHSVQVSDAGDGTAKITKILGPGTIPGVINPLREMNAPTIAGDMIRKMLPTALAGNASAFVPTLTNNVKSAALGAANNLGTAAQNFGGGILGGLGGLFGQHPALPRPFNLMGGVLQQQAPPIPQNRPAALSVSNTQRAQNDLRESGMLNQFGMIPFR